MGHNTCWHHRDISGSDDGQENSSRIASRGELGTPSHSRWDKFEANKETDIDYMVRPDGARGHGRVQYSML
ncbi:hypothetical protein BS47DRAFT_1338272, partial [Hydnum rufescens UP504]